MENSNYCIADDTQVKEICPEFVYPLAKDIGIAQIQLKKYLEKGATAFVVGKPGAYVNWKRTLIDKENIEVVPFIVDEKTYVPLRFFAENIGANVDFDGEYAIISYDGTEIKVNTAGIYVNGETIESEETALIRNDRMYIPIRTCGELFGKNVLWKENGLIIISDENLEMAIDDRLAQAMRDKI